LFTGTESKVNKCDFTIFKPIFDTETLKYDDVRRILEEFNLKYISDTERTFVFVGGDQQVISF